MWITGYTSSRLGEVKTLDKNNPYKVGVNGVFNVQPEFTEYEIDGILYKTFYNYSKLPLTIVGETSSQGFVIEGPYSTTDVINKSRVNTIFKVEKNDNSFEYKPLIKEEKNRFKVHGPRLKNVGTDGQKHAYATLLQWAEVFDFFYPLFY